MNPSYTIQQEIEANEKKLKELEVRFADLEKWLKKNIDRNNFDDVRREYSAVSLKITTTEKRIVWLKGTRIHPPRTETIRLNKTTFSSFA